MNFRSLLPISNGQGYSDFGELAGDDRPALPPINAKVRPVHRPNLAGVGQLAHAHQASIREVFSRRSRIRKRTKRRTVALSAPPWPGKQPAPAPSSQGGADN